MKNTSFAVLVGSIFTIGAVVGCMTNPDLVTLPREIVTITRVQPVPAETWDGIGRVSTSRATFVGTAWHAGCSTWVTNYHVIFAEPDLFVDGFKAEVLLAEQSLDVAVLRVVGHTPTIVYTLGTPTLRMPVEARGYVGFANQGWQVTTLGRVSSLNIADMIGFDGGIHPGMSGSPVVNLQGEVIGMVSNLLMIPPMSHNAIMGRLVSGRAIQTVLNGVQPDAPAIAIPQPEIVR